MVGHFSFINNLNFIIMNFNFQGTDVVPFNQPATKDANKVAKRPFVEANTEEVSLSFLKNKCIIPVFTKDNETTLSHQEFIDTTWSAIKSIFPNEVIEEPEVRVSHQIKGRTPNAIHIPVKDLHENQKTTYYERMAFIIRIPSITETINGNTLALTVGGVRALNTENLYNKKTYEKFKVFIGFQNMVCCNLCISTDGFKDELKAMSAIDLEDKILQLFTSYNMRRHIHSMEQLTEYSLSETQFAQLIGKSRLYNFLPKKEKLLLPELLLTDCHITTVAKDYYQDESFCKDESGDINLWKFYNLLTGSNKSSYVDTFIDRGVNAFHFTEGISHALNDRTSKHAWFIQ
jgi:hypothetical protein